MFDRLVGVMFSEVQNIKKNIWIKGIYITEIDAHKKYWSIARYFKQGTEDGNQVKENGSSVVYKRALSFQHL